LLQNMWPEQSGKRALNIPCQYRQCSA